jgi:hypothetical protein
VSSNWILERAQVLLGAALAVPLLVYAWIGSYSRYTADDYCWAGVLRQEGFLRAQAWWYDGFSPRFAFTFIVNLVELAGPAIVPFLPAAGIVTWVGVLTWTLRQLDVRGSLVLALTIAVATFATAPDLPQSLYWQTGMLTYLLPLVLATFLIGWIRRAIVRQRAGGADVLVSGAVTFVAGGLSETYLLPQNVALTLALGLSALGWRRGVRGARTALVLVAAALLGGVLALAVIVLAPATPGRVGGGPANVWLAFSASIATAAVQMGRLIRSFAPALALCLVIPALVACHAPRRVHSRRLAVVTAAAAAVVPFAYFASFLAQNGNPPARSLIVPGTLFVAWAVFLGYSLIGRLPRMVVLGGLLVSVAVPLGIAATTWPQQAQAAEYAALWDAEDRLIRQAASGGARNLVVPPLPRNFGEGFVTPDPEHFFNRCVARYYGLETIAASS